jgi:hypothetical protein
LRNWEESGDRVDTEVVGGTERKEELVCDASCEEGKVKLGNLGENDDYRTSKRSSTPQQN